MYARLNTIAKYLFPRWLHEQLISTWNKDGFKKYFANTGWMFLGRIVAFAISFLTIAYVARYLGPENLGKLSYAQSFVAIFSMLASLGIDQIVYRELIAKPDQEGEILGTALVTKLLFGTLSFTLTVIIASFINEEPLLTWLVAIIAFSFIVQPLGVLGHVFNARVLSKYPTFVMIGTAIMVPIAKLAVILFDKGVLYFAAIITAEALLSGIVYIYLYKSILQGKLARLKPSMTMLKSLFRDSWPLMFVGITGYLYARIDQVMLLHFIDATSVGLYEAAVRLTEPLGFLPGVVMGSLFPALINARKSNRVEYHRRLRSLAILALSASGTLALVIFIIAPHLVTLLYGPEFSATTTILRIYVWSTVGTIATMLMYNYFIAENKTYLQLVFTALGALANVILNFLLIPSFGAPGAAVATLITVLLIIGSFLVTSRWR